MFDKVIKTIEKYKMLSKGDRVIIAVSGGADSLSLLHLFLRLKSMYKLSIFAAHVDHMTRNGASAEDADFVAKLCKEWSVPLYIKRIDMKQYALDNSLSQEQAGREIRYSFFYQLKQELNADKIAVAHNKNDQVETIIMRLLRGTGTSGLIGIKPVRHPGIIRPLIDVERVEIERYCKQNQLDFRQDYTNYQDIYTRNKIRLELIPYIQKHFNPNIVDSIIRLSHIMSEQEEYLEYQTARIFEQITNIKKQVDSISIDLFKFDKQHIAIKKRLIRTALLKIKGNLMGIDSVHIQDIIRLATDLQSGKIIHLPDDIYAVKIFNKLVISKSDCFEFMFKDFEYKLVVPGITYIKEMNVKISASVAANSDVKKHKFVDDKVLLDWDKLNRKNNLVIRNRRPGDYIYIQGMSGKKKLKKFFIEKRIDRYKRYTIPMLCSGSEVIWIPGMIINRDFKVDIGTKEILVLEYRYLPA